MMGYDMGWTWWGMGLGMLGMALFWIAVIVVTAWLVLRVAGVRGDGATRTGSSALRILDERLARGEIDTEEFRARKAALEGGR